MYAHSHVRSLTCTRTHTLTHTHAHSQTHALTHMHSHTRSLTHMHSHTRSLTNTHSLTRAHTLTHISLLCCSGRRVCVRLRLFFSLCGKITNHIVNYPNFCFRFFGPFDFVVWFVWFVWFGLVCLVWFVWLASLPCLVFAVELHTVLTSCLFATRGVIVAAFQAAS